MDYEGTAQVIWSCTTQATAFAKDCTQAFITEGAASSLLFVQIVTLNKTL